MERQFVFYSRHPSALTLEEDVRYDAWGRGRLLSEIGLQASGRGLSLTDIFRPEPGYFKIGINGSDSGLCEKEADGARPVWIWWAV